MKTPPIEGWEPTTITYPVAIPSLDGKSVARTVEIEVAAWRAQDGEVYLDGEAEDQIEALKAREMGLLSPDEIKEIRVSKLKTTQKEISKWLQIGEKTWTRWESGRERPSRSLNVLLCALRDGRIDAHYLDSLRFGRQFSRLLEGENPTVRNRVVQYHTGRRVTDPASTLKTRPCVFLYDSNIVAHLAAAAKTVHTHETPWSIVVEQRSARTRQVLSQMESSIRAPKTKRSADSPEAVRACLDETFQG